ncbi:Hypothetical predicted protein [Mytilus galloprovincialis]|uniref:Major facilitator superfamily (MFS) profile domain-containing protein n=1 Tax=Mytilus galloprovincialis TaxID=29158 RepID=A0A8B6FM53_MYTGA|nr:Hypothetical predicted protein [Mytilus galloprovincialis]
MEDKAAGVIFWFCLLGVSGAVVLISIAVPSVELGSPVDFQCIEETNSSSSKQNHFKWHLDGEYKWIDPNISSNLSRWTIQNFTESDLNKTVKCTYGFEVDMFNSTSYKDVFLYIPKESEITGNYTQDQHDKYHVNLNVYITRVYQEPTCLFNSKDMTMTKLSTSGWFHDVTLLLKIPRKYHWCISDFKPMCTVQGKQIPDIRELKCPDTMQSFLGVCIVVVLLVIIQLGVCIKFTFYKDYKAKKTQYQQVSQQASQEDQTVPQQDQLPKHLVQHKQKEKQGEQQSRTTFTQRRSIFIAITGNSFLYGYNMAVLNNPAMTIIAYYNKTNGKIPSDIETREYVDNDYTINLLWSFVTAVYVLVGVLGAWSAEKIAAKFGRRKPMMYNTILGIIASAIGAVTIYSDNIFILILHRMIIGFYCGIGLILSGMYAMEISNFTLNKVKGSYGTYDRWFQLSITAGICVSSFLGISTILGHRDRWQWLLILNVVPVLFNLFLYKCPDSPIYILLQDDPKKIYKARKALKLLCPPNEVVKELDRLKDEVLTEDVLTLKKIKKLFSKPEFRVGLFLVCFLQIAQQLSGINIVIAYSSFIYQGSGVEIELIEWMVFGTTLMNFFTTPISLSVQEKGRRAVLLITTVFMGVALFMLFMTGLQCEEFFDQDAQGAAFNVSVALHWLCNFLVLFCFRSLQMSMESYVYLMFSAIVLVLCSIMYKILPETKNKTMTEIKNSKEYEFVLKWLSIQASETTDNQSSNGATEEVRLLHVT